MACADSIPARYVLCFMLFLGFMTTFLLRANLNVAIVAMVKMPVSSEGDPLNAVGTSHCLQTNQSSQLPASSAKTEQQKKPEQGGEFEWTEFQQSVILGSFFWGYLFFQVPGGRIAEVHGTKTVYGLALLTNGVLCFVLPFAAKAHWTLLLLIRAMQGLAQGVVFPALNAIVVRWVPLDERARFVSFAFQGASLGTVVAMPVCAWVVTNWGWESVFFFSGAVTLVWATAWWFLVFDTPAQHPRLGASERSYLEQNLDPVAGVEEEEDMKVPWKEVLRCRQFLLGCLAGIGSDWGFHTFFTLGPKYMKGALGFDLQESSWLSSVPYLSQYVFAMIYGTVADQMTKRHVPLSVVRRISVGVSHLAPTLGLLLLSVSGCNVTMSVVVFTLSVTMIGAVTSGFFQMPMDIAPNFAGLLTGVMNGVGSVTAVVSTPLAGALLQSSGAFHGWRYIFLVAAGSYVLGGLPYIFCYKAEVQPWNNISSKEKEKEVSLNQISTAVQDNDTKR